MAGKYQCSSHYNVVTITHPSFSLVQHTSHCHSCLVIPRDKSSHLQLYYKTSSLKLTSICRDWIIITFHTPCHYIHVLFLHTPHCCFLSLIQLIFAWHLFPLVSCPYFLPPISIFSYSMKAVPKGCEAKYELSSEQSKDTMGKVHLPPFIALNPHGAYEELTNYFSHLQTGSP